MAHPPSSRTQANTTSAWPSRVFCKACRKREEERSLQARDPREAKRLARAAVEETETRWANLEQGSGSLTEGDGHDLAEAFYRETMEVYRENPSEQTFWNPALYGRMWEPQPTWRFQPERRQAERQELQSADRADEILETHGLSVDETSQKKMIRAVAAAFQRAALDLVELKDGLESFDPRPHERATLASIFHTSTQRCFNLRPAWESDH